MAVLCTAGPRERFQPANAVFDFLRTKAPL